jgi:hypothetical protein
VKDGCWRVAFLDKSILREIYFFCDTDPREKTLEEILEYPQIGKDKDFSFRQALLRIKTPQIPGRFRQQKKLLRRITDDSNFEEHF